MSRLSFKSFIKESKKDMALLYKLTKMAMKQVPNSPKQKEIIKRLNIERLRHNLKPININEKAPPDANIEKWILANKDRFMKEYGPEKGMAVLYAKAWEMYNKK
jgi:hypothetical protein